MGDGRLTLFMTFLCIPAAVYPKLEDISGDFNPAYDRQIQCAKGVNLAINDNAKSVAVICNETQFDVSLLRQCSGYAQFKSIALMNCILPSSDIGETLGDYKPECFMVYSNGSWNYNEIIVGDLPNLLCLVLAIKQNVTYVLDNLPNLASVQVISLNLTTLPENFFRELTSLGSIHIRYSEIRYLPEKLFQGMKRIMYISLCCNQLEELPELLFDGLSTLKEIVLSFNRLTSLPTNIFKGLINLGLLYLNNNQIMQLPPMLLYDNINLNYININNNSVSFLPEDFLKTSVKLATFYACYCNITELPEKLFSFSPLLSLINVCNNKIGKLHENLFSENKWLRILYLNGNQLTSLSPGIFASNRRLQALYLNTNRLESIAYETFGRLSSLQTLALQGNKIIKVEEAVFSNLQLLKVLNLDNNNIQFLPSKTPFGKLSQLLSMNLADNNLTTFPSIEWSVYNITFLNLNYNRITFLNLDELPPSKHAFISLQYNNITTVIASRNFTFPENVKLEGNPFECNCSLKNFVDTIQFTEVTSLYCKGPEEFKNKTLLDVVPSYVLCPFNNRCPRSCRCYRGDTSAIVNCSSSNLTRVPKSLPENTSTVRLDHNFLTQMHIFNDNWSNVTNLNLDYNRLDPSKTWKFPSSLNYLSVRSNQLERLSQEFLEQVDEMPLLRLDIRDNQFRCNCSFTYFKLWFDKNIGRIVEANKVMCSRLFLHNNTEVRSPIIAVPLDAFCPVDSLIVNVPLIVSASIVAVLALAIVTCIVLFMKYKNTVLAYLYVHFPTVSCYKVSEIDGDKLFDAFISYTGSDREVVMSMLKELEEKPPFFKLCIHERDWLPGNPIVTQIEVSIQSSRKTVIVLSKEFLESMWCEMEFQMAYLQCLEDKIDRLIIVTMGDLPTRNLLPTDMQNLLATKTFLVWGERWFWEKLRYSLPHYTRPKLPSYELKMVDGMIEDLRNKRLI